MNTMTRLLMLAALASTPLTGWAGNTPTQVDPFAGYWNPAAQVAELTREERTKFRYQWQNLPPAEREAMMRELRQQWREVAPEDRQRYREELMQRNRERDERQEERRYKQQDEGYGQGYESRRWEYPESPPHPFSRPDAGNRGRR